jgi:hypothetical protein
MSLLKRLFGRRRSDDFQLGPMGMQSIDLRSKDAKRWEHEAYQGRKLGSKELDALVEELITIGKTRGLYDRSRDELVKLGWPTYGEEGCEYDEEGHHKRGREIGWILFRKGGLKLMQRVSYKLLYADISEISLNECWKYVGDDKDYWLG